VKQQFVVEERSPAELTANPANFRRHPDSQKRALRASLTEHGAVAGPIFNRRTGHLIDGHARVEMALEDGEAAILVNVVDMPLAQEKRLLRSFDQITSMALIDDGALEALIAEIDDAALEQILGEVSGPGNGLLPEADGPDVEFYSPEEVVEAARRVMGGIDLDPASCEMANRTVGATRYFTEVQDGLSQPWEGRIWINPPFFAGAYEAWFAKLCEEHNAGRVAESCLLMPVSDGAWFHDLLRHPTCFLFGRQKFLDPEGDLKEPIRYGCVVVYRGENRNAFFREFVQLGTVVTRVPGPGKAAERL